MLLVLLVVQGAAARADELADAVKNRLQSGLFGPTEQVSLALDKFYGEREYAPIWVTASGPTENAKSVLKLLQSADVDGLEPSDYRVGKIAELINGDTAMSSRADLEVLLSYAVVVYVGDLRAGRLQPNRINGELFIKPERPDPYTAISGLTAAVDPAKYLSSFTPKRREYKRLKATLARYREIAKAGAWSTVSPGKTIGEGDTGPRVAEVRKRLEETKEIEPIQENRDVFEAALAEAVKKFQRRHGLTVDGRIGKNVVAAMNVPIEARIDQMLLNMERRRWMPDEFGAKYVFVNVADFELKVVDNTKTIHVTRVVVGKQFRHRTPVFSSEMKYAVINPYWTPTRRIIRGELVPKARRDPNHLVRQGIRVFRPDGSEVHPGSVDWSKGHQGFRFRQDGGAKNALGRIKFMFPNRHAIYLHDTPSRRLFSRTKRTFSHGCIRVQNPLKLGDVLLKVEGWTEKKIQAVVKSGKRRIVRLKTPMAVHITYLTAWVNKDGRVHFRSDVYGRDKILAAALLRSRQGKKG